MIVCAGGLGLILLRDHLSRVLEGLLFWAVVALVLAVAYAYRVELGEAGDQNAPLGRAVIGGLVAATAATLLILPCVFASLQRKASTASPSLDPDDPTTGVVPATE